MFSRNSFLILIVSNVAYSCIPTQQTCINCAPFYDSTCDPGGYGPGPTCEDLASVAPSYSYSAGTCSVTLTCPGGGTPTFFPGSLTPAPGVAATCSESTGAWFLSGSGVNNMQCI
ncbi:hypothetical protein CAEBREN_00025 [Caenorhabditis brenneri]|uniref:Uncharacterized protein n=1 Tax=Caenorhabditis brenneri TaxID=135651 RepID=G0PCC7_CAEBE|nr:hypothetical protein CAEBREN_00025 [Caenorhabditis brenneri]